MAVSKQQSLAQADAARSRKSRPGVPAAAKPRKAAGAAPAVAKRGNGSDACEESIEDIRLRVAQEVGSDCDRWVGRQVRDLRKARRLSLKQLASSANLSIGLLSQIERGASSPSLRSLQALSEALAVPARWFFNDGVVPPLEERHVIVRHGAGRMLHLPTKGIVKELITPDLSGDLQMLLVTIAPGGSSGDQHYSHSGEEVGHVMAGTLELWLEEERFILGPGDSFRFASTRPHRILNPGKVETRLIWVTSPPFY